MTKCHGQGTWQMEKLRWELGSTVLGTFQRGIFDSMVIAATVAKRVSAGKNAGKRCKQRYCLNLIAYYVSHQETVKNPLSRLHRCPAKMSHSYEREDNVIESNYITMETGSCISVALQNVGCTMLHPRAKNDSPSSHTRSHDTSKMETQQVRVRFGPINKNCSDFETADVT